MMTRRRGLRLTRRALRLWRCVSHNRLKSTTLHPTTPHRRSLTTLPTLANRLINWGRRCLTGNNRRHHHHSLPDTSAVPLLLDNEEALHPPPPPKGHLVVYVGDLKEMTPPRRYVVPVLYFNNPLFGELLKEVVEDEFGYDHPAGGITIPCPVARFESVRTRVAAAGGGGRLRSKLSFGGKGHR